MMNNNQPENKAEKTFINVILAFCSEFARKFHFPDHIFSLVYVSLKSVLIFCFPRVYFIFSGDNLVSVFRNILQFPANLFFVFRFLGNFDTYLSMPQYTTNMKVKH